MEYKLVQSQDTPQNLEDHVNELISKGWVPLGGVSVTVNYSKWRYTQAMTLTLKEPG